MVVRAGMRDVAVIGIGMHPWGRFPDKTFVDLGVHAVREALADAGLKWSDIPAAVAGLYAWGSTTGLSARDLARRPPRRDRDPVHQCLQHVGHGDFGVPFRLPGRGVG